MELPFQDIENALAEQGRPMRLPPVLDAAFEAATAASRIKSTRQFLAFAVWADLLALILDTAHGSLRIGLMLRLGVVAPALAVCLLLLTPRRSVRQQGMLSCLPVLLGLDSIVLIGLSMGGRFPELYLSAAGMATFVVNAALPLRFRHAVILAIAVVLTMTLLVFACHGANDPRELTGTLLFNSVVTLLSLQLSYRSERNSKLTFLYELRGKAQTEALIQLNSDLERLSSTDPLTGLANRRALLAALERSRADARRLRGWFGLLLIDIDHFKRLNDAVGHEGGDLCLKTVAETIQAQVRHGIDTVARFGGEEFAVVLPDADLRSVGATAERIRQAVAERALPHLGLEGQQHVTVSVGATTADERNDWSGDDGLRRADAALYQAKEQGRNRVIIEANHGPFRLAAA